MGGGAGRAARDGDAHGSRPMLAGGRCGAVLVIHAVWRPGAGLALWAEDPSVPRGPVRVAGGPAPPHPFAASSDDLAAVLGDLAAKAVAGSLTLALPTRDGRPGRLPRAGPRRAAAGRPRGAVTPGAVAGAGARLRRRRRAGPARRRRVRATTPSESALGASVRHLVAVAEFALDLVGRGRTLPTVVEHDRRAAGRVAAAAHRPRRRVGAGAGPRAAPVGPGGRRRRRTARAAEP